MGIAYEWQPLQNRPKDRWRDASRFRAKWSNTMDLLERELGHLSVRTCVVQVDTDRSQFRLDGMLRADARLSTPAVALSFTAKRKALTFPCDTYRDWRDNVRAIALALEALRQIDRYGVTSRGEQYTGWAALPPPAGSFASKADALAFLRKIIGGRADSLPTETALREAEMATHPDRGGKPDDFKQVQAARKVLLA